MTMPQAAGMDLPMPKPGELGDFAGLPPSPKNGPCLMPNKTFILYGTGPDTIVPEIRPTRAPRDHEVLVHMRFAALNYRDLKIADGRYSPAPILPIVPLSDGSGEVIAVGTKVRQFRPGDRVVPIYYQGWHSGTMGQRGSCRQLGGDVDGVAQDYVVVGEADLVRIPDGLSLKDAAAFPCAAVTAWHGLVCIADIGPGDTVLVQGSGGVSLFALQIALMKGARVIATSGDDAKLARMRALGACAGMNYRTNLDWGVRIRELTGGRGVDCVVDVSGEESIAQSMAAARDGGHVLIIGNLSGRFSQPDAANDRDLVMTSIGVGSREMTRDVMDCFASHNVTPVLDRSFAPGELARAMAYLRSGRHFGKIMIEF